MQPSFGRVRRAAPSQPPRTPAPAEQPAAPQRVAAPGALPDIPIATIAISLVLIFIFGSELKYPVLPTGEASASWLTLEAFGAVSHDLVFLQGQPWRILTSAVLHGDSGHLIGNLITFVLVGFVLERAVGAKWLALIFLLSGIGGSIGFMFWSAPDTPGMGASGAIMGVAGAAIVMFLLRRCGEVKARNFFFILAMTLPGLAPTGQLGDNIGYAAHAGGFIVGVTMAIALQWIWPRANRRPLYSNGALAGVMAIVALYCGAFVAVAQDFPRYAARATKFAPGAFMQPNMAAQAEDLTKKYPRDPRVRLWRAINMMQTGNAAAAEYQIRYALGMPEAREVFGEANRVYAKGLLALSLYGQGRVLQARDEAGAVCRTNGDILAPMRKTLGKYKLCDEKADTAD